MRASSGLYRLPIFPQRRQLSCHFRLPEKGERLNHNCLILCSLSGHDHTTPYLLKTWLEWHFVQGLYDNKSLGSIGSVNAGMLKLVGLVGGQMEGSLS